MAYVLFTKTRPCNIQQFFTSVKMTIFSMIFLTILNVYPCKPQFYYIKVGCNGYKSHGHVILLACVEIIKKLHFIIGANF